MESNFKLLFLGDIVGRPGRRAVKKFLSCERQNYDFVIANVENASHGFGLTKNNHDELKSCGIDAMTSGNHIWDKKDIFQYIDESDVLIRPLNYHRTAQGVGYREFSDIVVINLMGRVFLPPVDCPFTVLENLISKLKNDWIERNIKEKIIFIDFHAEATAEKLCFAHFAADLGVNCVVGTHTHIQTADETIFDAAEDNKCAYITDAGFCGSSSGVIGMKYDTSLRRLITSINERFDIEDKLPYQLNAVEISFKDGAPFEIKRKQITYNTLEELEP